MLAQPWQVRSVCWQPSRRQENSRMPIFAACAPALTELKSWHSCQSCELERERKIMDDKLAADEARRSVQHEAVKSRVEGDVQAEIADRAQVPAAGEARQIDDVAGQFRAKAVNEVVETEHEVERGRGAARVSQIIDYIFYLL